MFSQNIKEVVGFNGYYVSDDGIIYSTKKNGGHSRGLTPMKLREDKDGYLEVGMYKDGKRYFRRAHRVVAEAFIPNPKHLPQINHKDGNVKNNNVDNLEWCTAKYNLSYGTARIRERDTKMKNGWWTGLNKKEYRKKYYEENKDKIKEYMKEYSHRYYLKKKEQIQNNVH